MSIYRDYLRREARATQEAHEAALRPTAQLLEHVVGSDLPADTKADFVLGGVNRRRFLQIGGASIAMSAVMAACGKSSGKGGGATAAGGAAGGSTTTVPVTSQSDITILRTASSLEAVAISVYQKASDNAKALGVSSAVSDVIQLFHKQHTDHGNLLAKVTTDAGGKAFMTPNPVVMGQIQPMIDALKTETDVLNLALTLEKAAASTYQASVGTFDNKTLNATLMSIGGVEAKHVTVIFSALKMSDKQTTDGAFQKTDGAVKPGTGIS